VIFCPKAFVVVAAACALGCSSSSEPMTPSDSGLDRISHPNDAARDSAHRTDAQKARDAGDAGGGDGGCVLGPEGEAIHLQCAGLYSDWAKKTVASDLKEFVPGLQLWSDGAQKTRWVHLPPATKIDTTDMDEWTFPVGTKFFKEFRLPVGSSPTPIRIETRLLWKQAASTWYRTTYRWSPDGESDAVELTSGELDAGGTGYEIPDQLSCGTCHAGRADDVLGFEAVGLAAPGASLVTLATLEADSLLSAPPSGPITIPGDAVEAAALGWLHVNCGTSCHNPAGAASGSHFFMRLDVATLSSVSATDTWTTGWNVRTVDYSIPDAAATYRLRSCDVPESAVYYRSAHRFGVDGTPYGQQMPPIDTHKVDDAGLSLLSAWIDEGCDGGSALDAGGGG
jgi:hypothetical protein